MSRKLTQRQRTAQQKKSAVRKQQKTLAVDLMTEEQLLAGLEVDVSRLDVADQRA